MKRFVGLAILILILISVLNCYLNRSPSTDQTALIHYLSEKKNLSERIIRDVRHMEKQQKYDQVKNLYDKAHQKINAFIDTIIFKTSLGDNDISLENEKLQEADQATLELENFVYSMWSHDAANEYYMKSDMILLVIHETIQLLKDESRRKIMGKTLEKYKWESLSS